MLGWHWVSLYLTKNVSIEYHRYVLNDENVRDDDLKVMNDDRRGDSSRKDAEEVVVQVAVENVRLEEVGDDGDVTEVVEHGQDDVVKQMESIEMKMIEARKKKRCKLSESFEI